MTRDVVTCESDARAEIDPDRAKPDWREGRHSLPFHELSDDEFEVFCFLLLKREYPRDEILYYGKTGDGGRDIVHRVTTHTGVTVRLIQCKRYESNVSVTVVRKDMAKVWVNVLDGTIPERPDEVVFYAVPDLTNPAKDLIDYQDRWREDGPAAVEEHLKTSLTDDLARHVHGWWPRPRSEAALSLTERAKKYEGLIEEFFGVRKVVDGGVKELANAVSDRILPPLSDLVTNLTRVRRAEEPPPPAVDDLKAAFARSSAGLLRWPTTVSRNRWIERPELGELLDRVASKPWSVSVVLGPPGCGKSALLARLGQLAAGKGLVVLGIKADQLRSAVDSAAKLAERLDLPLLTDRAVLDVASVEPVVVLLDQLDALADLADLRSERLQVLMNLAQRLGGRAGVHLVCSCREFEYQLDGRLSRLEAEAIRLQPPSWGRVSEVLTEHGVAADAWPEDARELLRIPQHLAVFLKQFRGCGEQQVFISYQQLVNDVWQKRVVDPGGAGPNSSTTWPKAWLTRKNCGPTGAGSRTAGPWFRASLTTKSSA